MEGYDIFDDYVKKIIETNGCFSHAYLFEVESLANFRSNAFEFVKILLCSSNNYNKDKNLCLDCNICDLIDKNCYDDLIVLDADSSLKKDDVEKMMISFRNKSFKKSKRVYIIFGVDKMTDSASNTILKFLEEPEDGIVAILVTENYQRVFETIRSRCTHFMFKNPDSRNQELLKKATDFVFLIEKNGVESIAFFKDFWIDGYMNKESLEIIFDYMIDIYMSVLQEDSEINSECIDLILKSNDNSSIIRKINILCDIKVKLKYNVNSDLIMDKLVIGMFN